MIAVLIPLASCSSPIKGNFTGAVVLDLYEKAQSAEIKYGAEPEPGESAAVPASFALTGKAVMITKPAFEGFSPEIPFDAYDEYSFSDYSWYTDNPEDVRYVILLEPFITPEGPVKTKNSLIYTIVDLSYSEQVYKDIVIGDPDGNDFPYDVLSEILEDLTL